MLLALMPIAGACPVSEYTHSVFGINAQGINNAEI